MAEQEHSEFESDDQELDNEHSEGHEGEGSGDDDEVVVIDGQEYSAAEVRQWRESGLRQDDYTRKTQELAEQRKSLAAAERLRDQLRTNPKATIEYLMDVTGYQHDTEDDEDLDPVERLERQVTELQAGIRQTQLEAQVARKMSDLHRRFGDFDDDELFEHAMQNDIGNLEVALRDMNALKGSTTKKQREDVVTDKKRKLVDAPGSRQKGTTNDRRHTDGPGAKFSDTMADVLHELGLSELPSAGN